MRQTDDWQTSTSHPPTHSYTVGANACGLCLAGAGSIDLGDIIYTVRVLSHRPWAQQLTKMFAARWVCGSMWKQRANRNSKILLGLLSKSDIIVAPVVVIPDMLSKKASLNENVWFDNTKGRLPNIATVTQASVENKKVCLKFNFKSFSRFASMHKIPMNIVTKEDEIKLWLFSS